MDFKLNILFEDKHVIVLEKPAKVPSQSDKTGDMDLLSVIKQHIKTKDPNVKEPYVGLVHRLDRPVGGIMVYAKTKFANGLLSKQIQEKQMDKAYYAVVCGKPEKQSNQLIHYLKRLKTVNMSKVVEDKEKDAKEARLIYNCLGTVNTEDYGELSLMKIKLLTGRHHQIRVQMAHIGLPLWGDNKYNKTFVKLKKWTQIALWSGELTFIHPKTKKKATFALAPKTGYPFSLFEPELYKRDES